MSEKEKQKSSSEPDSMSAIAASPLVFISHDSRDSGLAEAFGKLLKSVSAGMIKTFRSSDKKGTEGIDFGEEWYKRLMLQLQSTTDVIRLFTERSLDRPWILFEAGVAKGKLDTPVIGLALGVPLNRVSAGPFYQFMNMDDSEADLIKLVNQLAKRIPNLELDADVVKHQVSSFKAAEASLLAQLASGSQKKQTKEDAEENAITKLAEEMKSLPSRVAERLMETGDAFRRKRGRRFHPILFEELIHISEDPSDPVGILMAASLVRDDFPWLYELAMEAYRAVKSGDSDSIANEIRRIDRFTDLAFRGPFTEELAPTKDSHIVMIEFPRMLQRSLMRAIERKGAPQRIRRAPPPPPDIETSSARDNRATKSP